MRLPSIPTDPPAIYYITTSATSWKPPLTRCLKESVCGLILLSYGNIVVTEGLEPPTGGDPIRLMRPTLHLRHNICGEGMESNHRHKTFQIFALPTELPHQITCLSKLSTIHVPFCLRFCG